MNIILGIHEDHDASAALMINGEIVAAAQEERFSGLKTDHGFPLHSINYCIKSAGINISDIDEIALATHKLNPVIIKLKRNANFSVDDWIREQHLFWHPKILRNEDVNYYNIFKNNPIFREDDTYPIDHLLSTYGDKSAIEEFEKIRIETISKLLHINKNCINTITHEDCHVFYSYYASPMRGRVLAITAEGGGDYSKGSVSIMSEKGREELAFSTTNMIGTIYKYITLLLGMKPSQHEYKVMGLAPYANLKEIEKSFKVFEKILKVDGLNVVFNQKPNDLFFHFKEKLEGHRFDGIAGALQHFTEILLCKWVDDSIKHTDIKRFCFSGGVAQNIKACQQIMDLDHLEEMYICPAAGDTSLSIGACYYSMWKYLNTHSLSIDLKPVDNIYLGPSINADEVSNFLSQYKFKEKVRIIDNLTPEMIIDKIIDGAVIGRCTGNMEFGLRALGNRSIIADPRNVKIIHKINSAIKFRDFWMPFTPTILHERRNDYIINPKNIESPYMTMAYNSTPLAKKDLIAALHPADFTVRPQILKKDNNPDYYQILKEFEKRTGVGGLLNTSFNLHGKPIVLGIEESVYTFENSKLDAIQLSSNFLIERIS